jgi:hypothetical protein
MNLAGGSKISTALNTLFYFILIYSCVRSTHPLFLLYPADKSQPGLDLVLSLMVSGSIIAMTDSISETALEQIGVKSSSELLLPLGPSRGSRRCSPLPHTRSSGQGTWLCVRAEPSLAQGAGDRPDERHGGLCSAPSPPPGPVRPSGWCRQGNDTTWGWLSRCGDDFHGTVMTSSTRR